MKKFAHLASRLFNVPLMVEARKLEIITSVFVQRLGIEIEPAGGEALPPTEAALLGEQRDRKPYAVTDAGIAIIDVSGSLVNRASGMDWLSGLSSYEQLSNEIRDAATDPDISGILLRFDSPGGETSGAFDLANLISKASKEKPTWASVDDSCFSAAYLMASQAERIYVTQTGGTGSVGVIAMHMDQSAFDSKLGVKYTIIHAGARKKDFNPHEPITEAAQGWLEKEIGSLYGMFVDAVARGRRMSTDAVRATEAGLFTGKRAVDVGFADKIGTFRDALRDLTAAVRSKPQQTSSGFAASAAAEITSKEANMANKETRADATEKTQDAPAETTTTTQEEKKPVNNNEEATAAKAASAAAAAAPAAATAAKPEKILATADEVMTLCELGGKDLAYARGLLAKNMTLAEVSAHVLAEKKSTQGTTRSAVGASGNAIQSLMAQAADSARQNPSLSKEQHFARALRANPAAYEEYLAANPAQTGRQ